MGHPSEVEFFHQWGFCVIEEERKQKFDGGWVTALDVPPFFRTTEFIDSLASWCGVRAKQDDDSCKSNWLKEVRFKEKGNEDRFILVHCIVNHLEFAFPVRFVFGWEEEEKER